MDYVQDYITPLTRLLPPALLVPLIHTLSTLLAVCQTTRAHLQPLLLRVVTQPDIASVLTLIALFFISTKVLGYAYRAVMFWVNMALWLAWWGSIAVIVFWMYSRGMEGFVEDLGSLWEFGLGEYQRFSGEVGEVRAKREEQMRRGARDGGKTSRW